MGFTRSGKFHENPGDEWSDLLPLVPVLHGDFRAQAVYELRGEEMTDWNWSRPPARDKRVWVKTSLKKFRPVRTDALLRDLESVVGRNPRRGQKTGNRIFQKGSRSVITNSALARSLLKVRAQ